MTNERHEKALEAAVQAFYGGNERPPSAGNKRDMTDAIRAFFAVIQPVAWRYRLNGIPSRKWTVQKNKPDWYKPTMPDVELEPLFAPLPGHFTNGE